MMLKWLLPLVAGLFLWPVPASAQEQARHYSQCQAIAQALPQARYASFSMKDQGAFPGPQTVALTEQTVRLTYIGHSTFLIETPAGVTIATDYNGYVRPPIIPSVVTMNRAHTTHYTLTPDPGIEYVLHGWSDEAGTKAEHRLVIEDTYIRNVTSDIRNYGGGMHADGNSIFIFEVAGLCIGHLGHLHQELSEGQYAEIGRLDVLMVPVDGGLTMGAQSMSRVVKRLRSSLILPMHRPGPTVSNFLAMIGGEFEVVMASSNVIDISLKTLPSKPRIVVVSGMQ